MAISNIGATNEVLRMVLSGVLASDIFAQPHHSQDDQ
jgi:hypothetical protein